MRVFVPILVAMLLSTLAQASELRTAHSYDATSLFTIVLSGPCHYIDFCQLTTSVEFNGKTTQMPCCFPCSCTDDCWERGDCCPDKTPADDTTTRTRRNESCTSTIVNEGGGQTLNKPSSLGYRHYYTVNTCPTNTEDAELVTKCQDTPNKNQTSINDLAFVSSRYDSFIYKNRYCAECHDDMDFVQWPLDFFCVGDDMYMPSPGSEWISVFGLQRCSVQVSPPVNQNIFTESARCYKPKITACNISGYWDVYDAMIADACATYNFIYVYPTIKTQLPYANIFCYMCNNAEHNNIPDTCEDVRDTKKSMQLLPFTYVLDMDFLDKMANTQKLDNDKEERCHHDQVLDPLTDSCRQLLCPINSYAVLGRCERQVSSTSGLPIAMKMHVTVQEIGPSLQQMWVDDNVNFVRFVTGLIFQNVGFDSMACERCTNAYSIIYTGNQTGAVPIYIYTLDGITTTSTCQESFILSTLQNILNKALVLEYDGIPGELSNFTARLDINLPDYLFVNKYRANKLCIITHAVNLSEKFHCPSVRLSINDYQLFVNKSKKHNPSVFTTIVTNEVAEHAVCYEEYLAAVHKILKNIAVMGHSSLMSCMVLACIVRLIALL